MRLHSEYSLSPNKKSSGAFYTSHQVARFLIRWAVRSGHESVLDPSFGGGVFLFEACQRIIELGGNPKHQVFGIELDADSLLLTADRLESEFRVSGANLFNRDFFDFEPLPVNQAEVVVGNPPFIRYQNFTDEIRTKALSRALDLGVKLTKLSSSWAPFLVHAISFVKKKGRLAMVLPAELGYAQYAAPVLQYVTDSFGKVNILTFKKKLFADLSEDTLLILAQDKGSKTSTILHRDFPYDSSLEKVKWVGRYNLNRTRSIEVAPIVSRNRRFIEYLLPNKVRELYQELKGSVRTTVLGNVADVGIGYVTGANDFFHLSPKDADRLSIPRSFLRPAVRRGSAFQGLSFTLADWRINAESGTTGFLLYVKPDAEVPSSLLDYIESGVELGVSNAYKCRVRKPWYSVPHVVEPDAFLSYMSTGFPRLVTNSACAVAPNTLHVLRVKKNDYVASASEIAALWQTSLTHLSVEVEGHSLGGGMLKLEPTEAENCLIPVPSLKKEGLTALFGEIDELARTNRNQEARTLADKCLLKESLGLSKSDIDLLRHGTDVLTERRFQRGIK